MFKGTIIAQIIAVLVGVYLAKLYGEEAYGFLGGFISITSIASIIGTLELNNCIITSKTEKQSTNWFNFILVLIPVTVIIFFLQLFILSNFFFIEKIDLSIFYLSFIGSLIITYNLVHQNLFTYQKKFITLSNIKIFISICTVIFQFLLFGHFNKLGLIFGFLIAQILLLTYNFNKNKKSIHNIVFNKIKKDIKSNNRLIKFLLPSNIINSLANHLMPILILTFFGAKEAGVYFFSIKVLAAPLFLISSSISQVFYQKSSELNNDSNRSELYATTKKIVTLNLVIIISFLFFLNTLGVHFLNLLFENQWENLNLYILILSFLIIARSSFSPISSLIIVLDKNLIGLIFNSYLLIINIIAVYIGSIHNNILNAIFILSLFGGIGYFVILCFFLNHLKKTK